MDLATGVLAFASARNIVIVGDLQQLPNVLDSQNIQKSGEIWGRYSLPETYHFSAHSLLSSATAAWPEVPTVLLREHYRCHPKIINFCNQKFYGGKLIVMTEDHEESDVLTMYRTAPGNHARGHLNQRQIDVIRQEVLPRLERQGYGNIGIITPYRDQVAAIQTQLGKELEVATVHKFQGREKDAIILTSVDNVITEFVDDPRMLNVAVSRAVKSLTVVTSQDPQNDRNCHYLGREYMFRGEWQKAIETLARHLTLPSAVWADERCASMRYIARCLRALEQDTEAERWLHRAVAEAPHLREPYMDYAQLLYTQERWYGLVDVLRAALAITERPRTYICEADAWGSLPYDLLSLAYAHLGDAENAADACREAVALAPNEERLRKNLALFEQMRER